MNRIGRAIFVLVLALSLRILGAPLTAAQTAPHTSNPADEQRAQQVAEETLSRLLSVADKPLHSYTTWPPEVHVLTPEPGDSISEGVGDYNAFATAPQCVPYIGITAGLVSDILQYQSDRVGFVLGHELSHLLLGHVECTAQPARPGLVQAAFTRQQEYDADSNGMKLALRAGYSAPEALMSFRIMDEKLGGSSFEALGHDHPSFKERLAQLDKSQASLWRSMGAFQNGVDFLVLEQYGAAEDCFKRVTDEFPDALEAWVNLGYARLMRYADGLSSQNVKNFHIGQLAVGAFYLRPETLRAKVRGISGELWNSAVQALETAKRIKPDSALVNESLGLAYLVDPSGTPQLDIAIPYLEQAATLASKDSSLDASSQAAIKINLAVGYAAAGRNRDAENLLAAAKDQIARLREKSVEDFVAAAAVYYNLAALASTDAGAEAVSAAANNYEHYLTMTNPNSAWWPIAYERYRQLAEATGLQAKSESEFETRLHSLRRPLVALELGNDQRLTLGATFAQVRAMLGPGDEVPIAGRIRQVRYPARGLALTGDSQVLAIILNDRIAPELPVRAFGLGQSEDHLRVGMSLSDAAQVLQDQPYKVVPLVDFQTPYVFFPAMGLAISLTEDRLIKELVIAQIPLPR